MSRPPRDPREPLFGRGILLLSLLQGLGILVTLLAVFGISLARGQGELDARTLAFTTLIIANLFLMVTNRSWTGSMLRTVKVPNPALWWVIGGAVLFLCLVLSVPALRGVFRFSLVHPVDIAICTASGVLSLVWFEIFKKVGRKRPS